MGRRNKRGKQQKQQVAPVAPKRTRGAAEVEITVVDASGATTTSTVRDDRPSITGTRRGRAGRSHYGLTYRQDVVLLFSPAAWRKLEYLRDKGDTEIGGFGVTNPNDRFKIEHFYMVKQRASSAWVEFDDEGVMNYTVWMCKSGWQPKDITRVWIHTHPGNSAWPSAQDEETFEETFGKCDHAIMFILARGGEVYCRLREGFGDDAKEHLLHVRIDYEVEEDRKAWDAEYKETWERMVWQTPVTANGKWNDDDYDWGLSFGDVRRSHLPARTEQSGSSKVDKPLHFEEWMLRQGEDYPKRFQRVYRDRAMWERMSHKDKSWVLGTGTAISTDETFKLSPAGLEAYAKKRFLDGVDISLERDPTVIGEKLLSVLGPRDIFNALPRSDRNRKALIFLKDWGYTEQGLEHLSEEDFNAEIDGLWDLSVTDEELAKAEAIAAAADGEAPPVVVDAPPTQLKLIAAASEETEADDWSAHEAQMRALEGMRRNLDIIE